MHSDRFIVVCDNIRSTHNVGSIFRTSDGAGIDRIYLCGITPVPPRPDINKVSLGAEEYVPFEYRVGTSRLLKSLKAQGFEIIALENNVAGAVSYRQYRPRRKIALVLGSEVGGLAANVLLMADGIVTIPMLGRKESLNVSVAFGIIAYHISAQLKRKSPPRGSKRVS